MDYQINNKRWFCRGIGLISKNEKRNTFPYPLLYFCNLFDINLHKVFSFRYLYTKPRCYIYTAVGTNKFYITFIQSL